MVYGPARAAGVSTASFLNPPPGVVRAAARPRPMTSLLASASRLTQEALTGKRWSAASQDWQEDAWDMLDLVGEQRFLTNTLANRLSQARLYVGRIDGGAMLDDPEPVTDPTINSVLEALGGSPTGRSQMLRRLAVNLSISGEGWLVGVPSGLLPAEHRTREPREDWRPGDDLFLDDLEWRMLSTSEVSTTPQGLAKLKFAEKVTVEASPDDLYLIRVWHPHPRRAWEADSPTRSSLPVLRELVGLTMHISAQVDSRLAGAGVFIVPASAAKALKIAAGVDENSNEDPFTDALIEAMMTPINDRSSAAALVPLVVTVPDEATDKFQYFSFSSNLDTEARQLREEAIRRLALGQDAPPELLLGTAGMNHWGAWLVREDVVSTHIEPPLALICDALTTQYLRPALQSLGVRDADEYVVWYDVSHMITRPNRATDAQALHDKGVLSDEALRAANGFDDNDAPQDHTDPALEIVLRMVGQAPSLAGDPGIPVLVQQIREAMAGVTPEAGNVSDVPVGGGRTTAPADGIPQTDGDPAPAVAAAARPVVGRGASKDFLPAAPEEDPSDD